MSSLFSVSPIWFYVWVALTLLTLLLFVINFLNHFQFRGRRQCITQHEDGNGLYPGLLLCYLAGSILVSFFCLLQWNLSDPLLSSSACSFSPLSAGSSPLDFDFLLNGWWTFCDICILSGLLSMETYLAYSRFVGTISISNFSEPSHVFIWYLLYIFIFISLTWVSVTLLPLLNFLVCLMHFVTNSYFGYYFYESVRVSYAHVLADDAMRRHTIVADEMEHQILQIRLSAIFAVCSSLVSSMGWFFYLTCQSVRLLPLQTTLNNLLLFAVFTKNRVFVDYLLRCNWQFVCLIVRRPYRRRKISAWKRNQKARTRNRKKSMNLTKLFQQSMENMGKKQKKKSRKARPRLKPSKSEADVARLVCAFRIYSRDSLLGSTFHLSPHTHRKVSQKEKDRPRARSGGQPLKSTGSDSDEDGNLRGKSPPVHFPSTVSSLGIISETGTQVGSASGSGGPPQIKSRKSFNWQDTPVSQKQRDSEIELPELPPLNPKVKSCLFFPR